MRISVRNYLQQDRDALERAGVHPLLARLYAARRVKTAAELDTDAKHLIPPALLKNSGAAARLLADAIAERKRLLVVADYDCDGIRAGHGKPSINALFAAAGRDPRAASGFDLASPPARD